MSASRSWTTTRGEGCQIDLLLQTRRTVWVVEIKRKREIGCEVIDQVEEKVRRLGIRRGVWRKGP